MEVKWQIIFYESLAGDKPVEKFFYQQSSSVQAKILHLFELLEKYGRQLGMPHAKQLDSHIFELRVRGKNELRILYGFSKRTIYLLHAFKKQTRKTPGKEINIAMKRLTNI